MSNHQPDKEQTATLTKTKRWQTWLNKSEKDVDMDTRQNTSEYKITDGHRVSPSRNDLGEDWQDDGVSN